MYRGLAIALTALALVSCGPQTTPLEGTWAWFDPAACEGNLDVITFAGKDFHHYREGAVHVQGTDVRYHSNSESGAEWITATYAVEVPRAPDLEEIAAGAAPEEPIMVSRSVALTFEPQGDNILIFRGSVVDGNPPANAGNVIGRELYRCVDGVAVLDDANDDGLLDAE